MHHQDLCIIRHDFGCEAPIRFPPERMHYGKFDCRVAVRETPFIHSFRRAHPTLPSKMIYTTEFQEILRQGMIANPLLGPLSHLGDTHTRHATFANEGLVDDLVLRPKVETVLKLAPVVVGAGFRLRS